MSTQIYDKASRDFLLRAMFNKFIVGANELDDFSSIVFTDPMVEILQKALDQLDKYAESKNVDDLINKAMKED